jgi:zinc/manganese transport system substrate-binding protein
MSKYAILIILFLTVTSTVFGNVAIVTSTSDLKSIAEMVGGDLVTVESLNKGASNPHSVEVLPSYMFKVSKAQLYLKVGLDLDQWAQPIIDGSRNGKLVVVDCSRNVPVLEKPTQKVDASMGDVHPLGNPHYWLDPSNGLVIADNILNGLITVDPDHADTYQANRDAFAQKLNSKKAEWKNAAAALQGLEIVTFHNSWPYFAAAFGIKMVGFVEPKPGIEPSPSHTAEIIRLVKQRNIKMICMEPYFSDRAPKTIARETGAKVVVLPPSVGGAPLTDDYFALFDTILRTLGQK